MVRSTAAHPNAPGSTPQPAIRWWRNGSSGRNATGGWQPDPATLNTLTLAALAHAGPLRECLRRWFESLEAAEPQEAA